MVSCGRILSLSHELRKDVALRTQDKVIAIYKELGVSEYYNAIGGKNCIHIRFLKMRKIF